MSVSRKNRNISNEYSAELYEAVCMCTCACLRISTWSNYKKTFVVPLQARRSGKTFGDFLKHSGSCPPGHNSLENPSLNPRGHNSLECLTLSGNRLRSTFTWWWVNQGGRLLTFRISRAKAIGISSDTWNIKKKKPFWLKEENPLSIFSVTVNCYMGVWYIGQSHIVSYILLS